MFAIKVILTGLFLLSAQNVFAATTWFVRDDGGTPSQCTGLVAARYPGTGSGQACAFSHPRYLLGWNCGNNSSCSNAGNLQPGDTGSIDGDSHVNVGQQAQYMSGYVSSSVTPGCSSIASYDCTWGKVPAGPSSGAKTILIGTGTHRPQLWGSGKVWVVLNMGNNNIHVENIEVTDHSNCAQNTPNIGTVQGFPSVCNNSDPYGPWARDGIAIGGNNVELVNSYVHGIARYGIVTYSDWTNVTFTNDIINGNHEGGISTGETAQGHGTWTITTPKIEWNGCREYYPMVSSDVSSQSNYFNCAGQGDNVIADAIAFGYSAAGGTAGNWTITGPGYIRFNTQDGFDVLHSNGTGTDIISRITFEGNWGNVIKTNAHLSYIENNLILNDCGWIYAYAGQAISSTQWNNSGACRALGDAIVTVMNGSSQTYIYNNTIVGHGNIIYTTKGGGCTGSTVFQSRNNIIYGGRSFFDDTAFNGAGGNKNVSLYFYDNDGVNDANTQSCNAVTFNEDYDIVYGTNNSNSGCNGSHSRCGTNPLFSGSFSVGPGTYYSGNAMNSLVYLAGTSPAISGGISSLTYQNGSQDVLNATRSSPFDVGGLEYGAPPPVCTANGNFCSFNTDCCSSFCVSNSCSAIPACTANGNACSTDANCCSANCCSGTCASSCGGGGSGGGGGTTTTAGVAGKTTGKVSSTGRCNIF